MIFGVIERNQDAKVDPGVLKKIAAQNSTAVSEPILSVKGSFGTFYQPHFKGKYYQTLAPATDSSGMLTAVMQGKIYNAEELARELSTTVPANQTELVLALYQQFGTDFFAKLNGKFVIAIRDEKAGRLLVVRDHLGIEPVYYYQDKQRVIFSTQLKSLLKYPGVEKTLNYQAMQQYLLFNYNPGEQTFFNNIQKLRPAHYLEVNGDTVHTERFWQVSFKNVIDTDEAKVSEKLLELLRDTIRIRLEDGEETGTFLSGGMDSSTITGLMTEFMDRPANTFSYRCKSNSFDESYYAQFMAKHYQTKHHETEYKVQDVLEMDNLVEFMDEPFCDIGINVATFILGREAAKDVDFVFTGDGGDELFAGHPVYEADKMAAVFEKIPKIFRIPILAIARLLPDSDKKKNFVVKAKRFAISSAFPKELLSHRWRIYYEPKEIEQLLTGPTFAKVSAFSPYEDILKYNKEADGEDFLSHTLYSDYQTVVNFYLRRMNLNNRFHLEPRYPMLDYRLVDYCATLPSEMKYKGMSETKYIFKKTMAGVLPDEIVFRKDKLGHSIPLKNWMRDNKEVQDFIFSYLNEETVTKRGLFDWPFVDKMIQQHMNKSRNNSHRIWALAVLEMWLQKTLDD